MVANNSYLTPPNRRRRTKNFNSPALSTSIDLIENDDFEEKRKRRKSKLLSHTLLSPAGVQPSPGRVRDKDKRKSANLSNAGMSNVQLKEHYANCIKLSSENKITAKNAFALHLIDYMKDLLKESQKDSETNFQVASCTLDAGVKIYAYRVDCVHNDAYKILSNIRSIDINEEEANKADSAPMEGQEASEACSDVVKKTKKKTTTTTIETNLTNIDWDELDVDVEVDPFYQKNSEAFDEGGTAGLLSLQINSKCVQNDLMFMASIIPDVLPLAPSGQENIETDIFTEMLQNANLDSKDICPLFSSFMFSGWSINSQNVAGELDMSINFDDDANKFDVNAPVPLDNTLTSTSAIMCEGDEGDISDMEIDAREDTLKEMRLEHLTGTNDLTLSVAPSEYSYFSQDILTLWAGPLHWKLKPSRTRDVSNKTISAASSKRSAAIKVPLRINFDEDIDVRAQFTTGKETTYLKDSTLEKHAAKMTFLPDDLEYSVGNLFKLFLKDGRVNKPLNASIDLNNEEEDVYDYNNKNDREGFCPAIDVSHMGDDYDGDDGGDDTFGDVTRDNGGYIGDNLVSPPNKVQSTDINYAKSAKRIDIRKLKGAMWGILVKSNQKEKENSVPKPVLPDGMKDPSAKNESLEHAHSFIDMYNDLPGAVSTNIAKNLSTPMAFVCLLYLANENSLKLTDNKDLSDISIEDGATFQKDNCA